MADTKIALRIVLINCLPLELDYGKRVPKGDGLTSSILGSNDPWIETRLGGCPLYRLA
jgi:hypothetical protein